MTELQGWILIVVLILIQYGLFRVRNELAIIAGLLNINRTLWEQHNERNQD